jgi:hypothetical protein
MQEAVQRREGDADGGVDEGDRRHTVVQANGQGRKGRSEGGVLYIVSKCANTCKASSTA